MIRIGNKTALYLYSVATRDGVIKVDANCPNAATRLAQARGYHVLHIYKVG